MEYIIFTFVFVFGLIIGSFLNCFIWRLHKQESMLGRSHCPKCLKKISWFDNLPILSFLVLRGKCRNCKKAISWQYPVVEFITGILFLLVFMFRFPDFDSLIFGSFQDLSFDFLYLFRDWFMVFVLVVIFIYDLKWYLILDRITLPSSAIFLILNLFLGVSIWNILIAGLVGGGFFFLQFVVSNGRWIGGGDIRLGLLIGLFLARFDYLILALMLAYFMGSIVGIGLMISGNKKWGSKLPLGVFLSLATVVTMLWGSDVINWYFGLF